uniref:Reverse transcriptase domain-containing protein n=1 Tax=Caenorhabditis tropicalis TaxID=1561998 RepID=A0A1I7UD27_9PELO
MMLSTANNPYRGGNNNNNSNNSNHRMVIEDVTDDPEYSSYGNENEKPENEEEGAFVEYEKLDKMEDPASFKILEFSVNQGSDSV